MLYSLTAEQLKTLDGFKDKKTSNITNAIEKSKSVELDKFIYGLGIDGVGKKTAKDLAAVFKSYDNLKNADFEKLTSIDEIGEIIAKNILEYFDNKKNIELIEKLFNAGVKPYYEQVKKEGVFTGEKFVLTGTLESYKRSEASKIIENLGGEVLTAVTKETTVVLAGESAGSKMDKAKALGIKIMSEEEFKNIIKT